MRIFLWFIDNKSHGLPSQNNTKIAQPRIIILLFDLFNLLNILYKEDLRAAFGCIEPSSNIKCSTLCAYRMFNFGVRISAIDQLLQWVLFGCFFDISDILTPSSLLSVTRKLSPVVLTNFLSRRLINNPLFNIKYSYFRVEDQRTPSSTLETGLPSYYY